MIAENTMAPGFELEDQEGNIHSLEQYKGQKVLLYFYPKDDTPGCTIQGECLRDRMNELKDKNVQVLGVSADDVASHKKFSDKFSFNFPILADVNKKIVQEYGVWVEKNMMGKTFMGIQRDAYLIDEEGNVLKHYEKVKPKDFVDQVLQDL